MIKRQILLLAISLMLALTTQAQELTVKSMEMAVGDQSASILDNRRLDNNQVPCALVKVQLPSPGAVFEGNVIQPVEYKTNEYWVYMSKGSKELHIKHPNHQTLVVNFPDYGIRNVESLNTYKLVIAMPQPSTNNHSVPTIPAPSSPFETITIGNVQFRMIYVEGGTFKMGSEQGYGYHANPIHKVTLSAYSIGETEVTQELWEAVMGSNPSEFKGANLPVDNVSWDDCQVFIQRLNRMTGRKFRLPTEAEWEYAARGGNKSNGFMYNVGNDFNKVATYAWYGENSNGKNHPVAHKLPNELDLYDMGGNVWEWCSDWYGEYIRKSQTNPTGPSSGSKRVMRGGGRGSFARQCSVANRIGMAPDERDSYNGLRLVLQ